MSIATSIFLIAIGAILRYAINLDSDIVSIPTVGLILMIAGFAGLAISLLYELLRSESGKRDSRREEHRGYDDPTRRM